MTPKELREHAAKCREVAGMIQDVTARRILIEAADDYLVMAQRETAVLRHKVPAYQHGPELKADHSLTR